ncbi:MAG TPA: hypothetical protein VGN52_15775 [Burkholderiales bacterium]
MPASVPSSAPAIPIAATDAARILRDWLAGDQAPVYALDDLLADPLRARAACLIATRGEPALLHRVLEDLLGRPEASAIDRMLLAEALITRGTFEQAHDALQEAAQAPDHLGARAGALLGEALIYRGELDAAVPLVEHALAHAPEAPLVHILKGILVDHQGDAQAALAHYRRAVAARPAEVGVRVGLAMGLLRCGRLQEGFGEWVLAEHLAGEFTRESKSPVWDGRELHRDRLLLLTSNGHGDAMQLLRFARDLRERHPQARLSVQVRPGLSHLAAASGWFERIFVGDIGQDDFDWQASLTHLPQLLDLSTPDLKGDAAYLAIPAAEIERAATWLPPRRPGRLRVGLRWNGNPGFFSRRRDVPFDLMRPLFAVPGIDWVAVVEDAAALAALTDHPLYDVSAHLTDFCATGALLHQLDLFITVDTSTAHLAGALHRPAWVLTQPCPEWRWGQFETRTPWYGSLRLFRHRHGFDWAAMVAEIAEALALRVREGA